MGGVLIALTLSPFRFVGSVLKVVSWPIRVTLSLVPESVSGYFTSKSELIAERNSAQDELTETKHELDALTASIPDYDLLRSLRQGAPEDVIMSAVILTPNQSPYDTLVLDRGTNDGVQDGAVVRAYEGRPIGVVVRAEPTTSVVTLFSSPGIETVVYVRGANTHARAVGLGGGILSVLVPHGAEVHEGDEVLLPSIGTEVIGTASWISDDQSAPGTIVHVPQSDALTSLRYVAVDKEVIAPPTIESITETLKRASLELSQHFIPLGELASTTPDGVVTTTTESVE